MANVIEMAKIKAQAAKYLLEFTLLTFFLSNNEESCQLFVHQARLFLVVHKEINTNDKKLKN